MVVCLNSGSGTSPTYPKQMLCSSAPVVRLLCACGRSVTLQGDKFVCQCGILLGQMEDSVAVVPPPTPYWGEIPADEMQDLLSAARQIGWREAVQRTSEAMRENIMNPNRAAFQDLLPIPEGSTILDVGAGMGGLSVEMALRHQVVALESVPQRARFISLRKVQDHLSNLTVLNADLNVVRFDSAQFDAIVVNGVLEWVGLFDMTVTPDVAQRRFLKALAAALKPSGVIYIGIENRIGIAQFRGAVDHGGLRYTSLLPRFLARYVCRREARYRSALNVGYRTYTYTFYGYRRLFRTAGLDIVYTWIPPLGYNLPKDLVPLTKAAIQLYVNSRSISPPVGTRAIIKNCIKRVFARPLFWRLFGSDFAFLLQSRNA